MSDNFIFNGSPAAIDPAVFELVQRETRRQRDVIILAASESETARRRPRSDCQPIRAHLCRRLSA